MGTIAVITALALALPLPAAAGAPETGPPSLPDLAPPSMTAPAPEPVAVDEPGPAPAPAADSIVVLAPRELGDPTASPTTLADPFARRGEAPGSRGEAPGSRGDRLIARPIPRWKTIGLGVSAGVMAASFVTALGLTIPVLQSRDRRGPLYARVERAARASLSDGIGDGDAGTGVPNDVDPDAVNRSGEPIDACALARTTPVPDMPDAVYNAEVAHQCDRAQTVATAATGMWVVFGLSTISTAVFTGLLFARSSGATRSAVRRHQPRLGAGPSRGGWALRASVHF